MLPFLQAEANGTILDLVAMISLTTLEGSSPSGRPMSISREDVLEYCRRGHHGCPVAGRPHPSVARGGARVPSAAHSLRQRIRFFLLPPLQSPLRSRTVRAACPQKGCNVANAYQRLAERLNEIPNGFPPTPDGVELRILAKIFTPEEAELASKLRLTLETPEEVAARLGDDPGVLRAKLKAMFRKGLIRRDKKGTEVGFGLMPFAVGIYEMQLTKIDGEFARLFEDYYRQAFGALLNFDPPIHRVIPVGASVRMDMEVRPFESAADILADAQSWAVLDCICRKQKALLGQPCEHPLDVCLTFRKKPGAFDHAEGMRAISLSEAMDILRRANEAGLVHTVSNNQKGLWYLCNCCTCSCAILRGMADLGIANVVARSSFVNQVETERCAGCELCLPVCQFKALSLNGQRVAQVDRRKCVGCGVCASSCPEGALALVLRPQEEIEEPPLTIAEWMAARAVSRGLDISQVL
jgi:electron transport complex protein RnfB